MLDSNEVAIRILAGYPKPQQCGNFGRDGKPVCLHVARGWHKDPDSRTMCVCCLERAYPQLKASERASIYNCDGSLYSE